MLPLQSRTQTNGARTTDAQQFAITDLETSIGIIIETWSKDHPDAIGLRFTVHVRWIDDEQPLARQLDMPFDRESARELEWQRAHMRDV